MEMVRVGSTLLEWMEVKLMHTFQIMIHVVKFTWNKIKIVMLKLKDVLPRVKQVFFSVLLHKLGHSLGLANSWNKEAVMCPWYQE